MNGKDPKLLSTTTEIPLSWPVGLPDYLSQLQRAQPVALDLGHYLEGDCCPLRIHCGFSVVPYPPPGVWRHTCGVSDGHLSMVVEKAE